MSNDQLENNNSFSVWGFIKGFGKLLIGFLLLLQGLIGLILLILVVTIFTSISNDYGGNNDKANITIADNSAFLLNPRGIIVEQAPDQDPLEQLIEEAYGIEEPSAIPLSDVIRTIRAAKDDKRIKAMVMDLDNFAIAGTSKVYALAKEIKAFKESGKKVYAISDFYGQSQYLLAAQADEIIMNEAGAVTLYGYGVYRNYYKSFLEKIKVTSHVFRVGTYKAAVEPQLRDDMSPEAKEANLEFASDFWQRYLTVVSNARSITPETIHNYADQYNIVIRQYEGNSAKAALETGFIDKALKPSEIKKFLTDTFGKGSDNKGFKNVGFTRYLRSLDDDASSQEAKIAVITAAGTIVPGKSQAGQVAGSTTIVDYLEKAKTDKNVKAVVLRVDSPGGSAFASEVIHDAIVQVKAAGKPVIVSMGSVAASGGYLIAAPADEIWASPTTITGSIGIFATLTSFENLASEIGIYTDGIGTTNQSGVLGFGLGPLPEVTKDALQAGVEHGYERFLEFVSEGRGLDRNQVDSIGQGRIWTGDKALELKLVDKIGGLDEAIQSAAEKAGIVNYSITRFEDRRTPFDRLFRGTSAKIIAATGLHKTIARHQQSGIGRIMGAVDKHVEFLDSFNDPNALYMRCLACENVALP